MNLYKFTHASIGLQILEKLAIRFTPPSEFNDTFEVSPYMELFSRQGFAEHLNSVSNSPEYEAEVKRSLASTYERLDAEQKKHVNSFEQYQAMVSKVMSSEEAMRLIGTVTYQIAKVLSDSVSAIIPRSVSETIGVLCLAGHPFSELLWAHYANSHTGVAIVFFENHEFFQQTGHPAERIRKVRQVVYQEERPNFKNLLLTQFDDVSNEQLETELFFTKSDVWAYECERRCVRPFAEASETTYKVDGTPVHLYSFPPDALQGVVFGARCSQSDIDSVYRQMVKINEKYDLRLVACQIKPHKSKYSLELEPYYPT